MFLDIDSFNKLTASIAKKSFNTSDLRESGLPYAIIPQQKLRTRFRYEMGQFFETVPAQLSNSKEDNDYGKEGIVHQVDEGSEGESA